MEFTGEGVFILNEGNYGAGNSSLSYYDPVEKTVVNEAYARANGERLGEGAQSMAVRKDQGYLIINNSEELLVIDINTFKLTGTITGFNVPRYVHFLSDTKAYVTEMYSGHIAIIDPQQRRITGYIDTPGHPGTEQMVQYGKYVFTNCWSYDNKILVIDTELDRVVDEIEVGIQPTSLVLDRYGKIWTITDGGYEGSPYGWEAPALYRIDAATRQVEREFLFEKGDWPSEVCIDAAGEMIYFINKAVWCMWVMDENLPDEPFIPAPEGWSTFYGLGVNPVNSDVYVSDAIDYSQPGVVYRFSSDGRPIDTINAGIIPSAFCFK